MFLRARAEIKDCDLGGSGTRLSTYPGERHGDCAEHGGGCIRAVVEDGGSCHQGDSHGKHEDLGGPVDEICAPQVVGFTLLRHDGGSVGHAQEEDQCWQTLEDCIFDAKGEIRSVAARWTLVVYKRETTVGKLGEKGKEQLSHMERLQRAAVWQFLPSPRCRRKTRRSACGR